MIGAEETFPVHGVENASRTVPRQHSSQVDKPQKDKRMRNQEALAILEQKLQHYRNLSYRDLVASIGSKSAATVTGESGTLYQLEFEAFWDGKAGGNLRVLGAIDDGGVRSLVPVTMDFIKCPDDSFVGE